MPSDAEPRLQYERAVNSPCSLAQDSASCWINLAQAGLLPDVLARAPMPAYADAHRATQILVADPSVVSCDIEVALSLRGKTDILPRGASGYGPIP